MSITNKEIVAGFIEEIWNQKHFNKMGIYLHPEFKDHSLPPSLPPNQEGLKFWIMGTGKAFENQTFVDEIVGEDDKVIVKIKMLMKHIGKWRDIEPTGAEVYAAGYRYFKLIDFKIIEHWALIDDNAIENHLKEVQKGCKVQV
ncbi:putative ester cyclase [Flammeovirgaceae bacterium 311]|nr:putative ester cyclase [Flammeovirgaceae bacterium 311]